MVMMFAPYWQQCCQLSARSFRIQCYGFVKTWWHWGRRPITWRRSWRLRSCSWRSRSRQSSAWRKTWRTLCSWRLRAVRRRLVRINVRSVVYPLTGYTFIPRYSSSVIMNMHFIFRKVVYVFFLLLIIPFTDQSDILEGMRNTLLDLTLTAWVYALILLTVVMLFHTCIK